MPGPVVYTNAQAQENLALIVNGVCSRCSLPQSPDPAGGADPMYTQIVSHVNDANHELWGNFQWPEIIRSGTIPIFADSSGQKEKEFNLPSDFLTFIDQTQWNRDSSLPALGPLSYQAWKSYTVRNWHPALTFFWQLRNGKLWVMDPPFVDVLDAPVFEFFYKTNGSVIDADDANVRKNFATKNGDIFVLDGLVICLLARVKFLGAKGFDTASAEVDYQRRYEQVTEQSIAAPVLSLSRSIVFPYLGEGNVPDTGFGTPT